VNSSVRANAQLVNARSAVTNHRKTWLFAVLGFTVFGLLSFEYRYLDDLARGHQHTFAIRMFEEMTGAYVGLVLFPFVVWAVRRTRIRHDNWMRMVPMNLLVLAAFSVCDTALMSLSRGLLSPVFGLGRYDYGNMLYRYPMEFAKHVSLFIVAAGAIYIVDSYREARNRQLAAADLEARLAEAQLQNLRLQLQPHFLFNALNTISAMMHEDVNRADAMLVQLSDLLRQTLRAANVQEITLDEELAMLRKYIAVMEGRFGDDLNVEFTVDPALSTVLVPQLILQPLVENSIRYARDPQTFKLAVHIRASREGDELLLQVRDQGPGIPDLESGGDFRGIGLSNTEQRLNGLYGSKHQLILENQNGLTVTIRLPLRTLPAATEAAL
jgi:two-component system, LytTR family, sensor kinase